jgi:hypothetical protein
MIEFTPDQKAIMDYLMEQVDNPEGHNVIVSGSGGTGKTTMVCELIVQLLEMNKKVAVTAMTGKATAVLRNKVWALINERKPEFDKDNLKIETVAKITKESKVLGLTDSGETLYTNTWRNPKGFGNNFDVLFVDELSMVPHFISQWWQMAGIRVFGFGDECQLPEVTTGETKKELTGFQHDLKVPQMTYVSGYGVKVLKDMAHMQLHTVLRSDNDIAHLCNALRDFKQTKSSVVKLIKEWSNKSEDIIYSTSIADLETDPSWQIIAYTNKMCATINNQLCIGDKYPELSDKIILFDNLNPLKLYNGDTLLFGDLLQAIMKHNHPGQKRKIYVCIKWQGKMPDKNSPNDVERNFFNTYVRFRQAIDETNSRRMYALPNIIESSGYAEGQIKEWLDEVEKTKKEEPNPGKCFSMIVENLYDTDRDLAKLIVEMSEPMPQLYMINCDFGYAITTHRSQGSEYEKVCYLLERFDRPLLYTGISRAKKKVKVINLTKES